MIKIEEKMEKDSLSNNVKRITVTFDMNSLCHMLNIDGFGKTKSAIHKTLGDYIDKLLDETSKL